MHFQTNFMHPKLFSCLTKLDKINFSLLKSSKNIHKISATFTNHPPRLGPAQLVTISNEKSQNNISSLAPFRVCRVCICRDASPSICWCSETFLSNSHRLAIISAGRLLCGGERECSKQTHKLKTPSQIVGMMELKCWTHHLIAAQ